MKKSKRVVKSKEEILKELKANPEFTNKMQFIKKEFFPALCKASDNIADAQILLAGFNTTIMQQFLDLMKEKKLVDLTLGDKLDKESPKYKENLALLGLFYDMTIFEAKELIEGMKNELALFLEEESRNRPLTDLKTKWIDEM